ncbi:MAG: CoA-transferase [Actinobacteria bacterium]|nr:MAG: CoA-transferase [Actinomycetota bacterium]
MTFEATLAEYCVVACAEAFRGDGEVLASAFGFIPTLGARLARATFEPDLLLSDGEAYLVANDLPLGSSDKVIEGWIPFRSVFDVVWSGRRHVMMGATQLDRYGNQNISSLGPHDKPKVQLIGSRGAPGNTVNHATSYWVPNHSPRVFVEEVDFVSGVGTNRGAADIKRIVTNLCSIDFVNADRSARLRSVHPFHSVDDVISNTGFDLVIEDVTESRAPTDEELKLIREVLDPTNLRDTEIKS